MAKRSGKKGKGKSKKKARRSAAQKAATKKMLAANRARRKGKKGGKKGGKKRGGKLGILTYKAKNARQVAIKNLMEKKGMPYDLAAKVVDRHARIKANPKAQAVRSAQAKAAAAESAYKSLGHADYRLTPEEKAAAGI